MSSYNGKVIISGEHSVVYGELALAAPASLKVTASVVDQDWSEESELVRRAIELAGGDRTIHVRIESEIPIGAGLGSSAAVAAATISAVRIYLSKPTTQDELFNLAFECERLSHGNPSGVDPAAVVYGGLIAYTKGKPVEKLIIKKPIEVLLVNTGKPEETTKEMVELVAKREGKERIITEIGRITKEVRERLVVGEETGELFNKNGILLEELGVVGEQAKALADKLRGLGAAVKITGAGGVASGSGMMLVFNLDLAKVKVMLDNMSVPYYEITLGGI